MIKFTKMQGIGNDYIYIDCTDGSMPADVPALSEQMSPRHFSVGADGIILILPSDKADFGMRIFNADGSEAQMCGNGSRCVGKYVYDHRLTDKTVVTLETLSGIKILNLHVNQKTNLVDSVTVDMGAPSLLANEIGMTIEEETFIDREVTTRSGSATITAVSMGNPHGVLFTDDDPTDMEIEMFGSELEHHSMWSNRGNIEFAHVIGPHDITMRVWERGSGETMACGTGACAAAVAAITTNRCKAPVTVHLRGGVLTIDIDQATGHVLMTGPAREVYSGVYDPK